MLVAGMFFISLIIMRVWNLYEILNPLIISIIFSLMIVFAEAMIWRRIAEKNPEGLTGFYTAVSGFRMLLALGTMLVYYIIMGSETMMTFSWYLWLFISCCLFITQYILPRYPVNPDCSEYVYG